MKEESIRRVIEKENERLIRRSIEIVQEKPEILEMQKDNAIKRIAKQILDEEKLPQPFRKDTQPKTNALFRDLVLNPISFDRKDFEDAKRP